MKKLFLILIKGYQLLLRPVLPPACRFNPSCSQYSYLAVSKYGPIKGLWLSIRRILKCNPWNPGGYDPVP